MAACQTAQGGGGKRDGENQPSRQVEASRARTEDGKGGGLAVRLRRAA